jgi:hypothetical protein
LLLNSRLLNVRRKMQQIETNFNLRSKINFSRNSLLLNSKMYFFNVYLNWSRNFEFRGSKLFMHISSACHCTDYHRPHNSCTKFYTNRWTNIVIHYFFLLKCEWHSRFSRNSHLHNQPFINKSPLSNFMKIRQTLYSLMLSHIRTEGQEFHIRGFLFFTFVRRPKMYNKTELNLSVICLLSIFRTTWEEQNYPKTKIDVNLYKLQFIPQRKSSLSSL